MFSVKETREYARRGAIEEWFQTFLTTVGDNPALSEGLKLQKRYWVGPVLIDVSQLHRCCGREPETEFVDSAEAGERHIERFRKLITDAQGPAPLPGFLG
ncbi:MAG: hypothetical protein AB1331_05430 [Bacillota bacterium]